MITESSKSGGRRSFSAARLFQLLAPFLGLVLVLLLFSTLEPGNFANLRNFRTIATQTVIVGLGAIGMTYVIISAGIDLSVGSLIAMSSVVVACSLKSGVPPLLAALLGVATGALLGAVNGVVIATLRILPFIVTLGMLGVARGLAKYIAGEQKVDAPASWLPELMVKNPEPRWLLVAPGIWLTVLLALAMSAVLRRTRFGLHAIAIGSSEATAYLCGIRVERVKIAIYALCGAFAGLAGVLQFCRLTVGDPTTGIGEELNIIAAVVIGGGSLAGGEASILGAMIGAFLMAALSNGCGISGVPNYVQEILIGVIIVVAVAIDQLRHRRRAFG